MKRLTKVLFVLRTSPYDWVGFHQNPARIRLSPGWKTITGLRLFRWSFIVSLFITQTLFPETFTNYVTGKSDLPSNQVEAVCIDGNGDVWFGTNDGLCRFDGNNWQVFRQTGDKQTLADNHIFDIQYDVSDYGPELWIGTKNGATVAGLGVDALTFATPYRMDNTDLVSNTVFTITIDSQHNRWFGTDGGVASFGGDTWGQYTRENWWIYHNRTMSSATGPDDMNYFGSEGAGVARLKMDPVDGITSASAIDWSWSEIPSDSVYAIYIEADGDQWYGTDHGVGFHDTYNTREDWTVYRFGSGLAGDTVLTICEDLSGNIWFGTTTGLSRFDGADWTSWSAADGLAGDHVNDIAVDAGGSLWIATNDGVSFYAQAADIHDMASASVPKSFTIMNFPNPFNMQTRFYMTLAESGPMKLTLYNTLGKKISTLMDQTLSAGTHMCSWNGLDDAGRPVGSGIYIARFEHSSGIQNLKITLTK